MEHTIRNWKSRALPRKQIILQFESSLIPRLKNKTKKCQLHLEIIILTNKMGKDIALRELLLERRGLISKRFKILMRFQEQIQDGLGASYSNFPPDILLHLTQILK